MLSYRQALFLDHYIRCANASEAVKLAGYKNKVPWKTANRLLKLPEVVEAVRAKREEMRKRLDMSKEDVEAELAKLGREAQKDSDRIRSLEVLSRLKGYLSPESETKVAIFNGISRLSADTPVIQRAREVGLLDQVDDDTKGDTSPSDISITPCGS